MQALSGVPRNGLIKSKQREFLSAKSHFRLHPSLPPSAISFYLITLRPSFERIMEMLRNSLVVVNVPPTPTRALEIHYKRKILCFSCWKLQTIDNSLMAVRWEGTRKARRENHAGNKAGRKYSSPTRFSFSHLNYLNMQVLLNPIVIIPLSFSVSSRNGKESASKHPFNKVKLMLLLFRL